MRAVGQGPTLLQILSLLDGIYLTPSVTHAPYAPSAEAMSWRSPTASLLRDPRVGACRSTPSVAGYNAERRRHIREIARGRRCRPP